MESSALCMFQSKHACCNFIVSVIYAKETIFQFKKTCSFITTSRAFTEIIHYNMLYSFRTSLLPHDLTCFNFYPVVGNDPFSTHQ